MTAWLIDVYTAETDRTPSHRCVATADTQENALLLASQTYSNDKVVVSIGVVNASILSGNKIKQLW